MTESGGLHRVTMTAKSSGSLPIQMSHGYLRLCVFSNPTTGLKMTKKGQDLLDEHEVMRYVPNRLLRRDGEGNPIGFVGDAFKLRPAEDELSLNWLEYFEGSRPDRIEQSVKTFRRTLDVKPSAAFGIANVGNFRTVAETYSAKIRIVYDPIEKPPKELNLSHTKVRKLPREDLELFDALAVDVFTEMIANSSIPA